MKTKNGAETVYTYNELNQLVYDSENTYEYDLNGNLVRVIGGAQSALYEYNSENKLVKATVQQGVNVVEETYTYDYAGNRTSKTTSTSDGNFEVVKYLNDNSSLTNVLAELDFEGNVRVYYTIGADLISQERGGRTYTYLYDGHGSVVGLMSESGSVTDTYTYDAFGNLLKSTGRTQNNYRYCGEQFDSTTGLYYLRARYMDTSTGRFISQDSYAGSVYDPVSLHKYLYANSNPVMYSDPSGYSAENDLHYYQQAWLTIDQAIEYEQQLLCSSCNEIAYNAKVLEIGREIIHQLTMTAIEYALASFLEDYVDPQTAREIANGVVTALDLALKGRNKAIDEKLGFADSDKFPENPNELFPEIYKNSETKSNGTTSQVINFSDHFRIRAETHPLKPGEQFNPRHHGQHYHVEIRIDSNKSWNNKKNVIKICPYNYIKGDGTGFVPGEDIPK